jgi:hypothetical protein
MHKVLVKYLSQRSDAWTFLLPTDLGRTLDELFPNGAVLPEPFKIYPSDESQQAVLGFPLSESPVMKDLDAKLDRWLSEEIPWQVQRVPEMKEKAQMAFAAYLTQVIRVAENAMMSNLLSDYHGVFWLAHSFDLARQFSSIPRRVSVVDSHAGRTQGDALKYRIYSKWASETREQMNQVAARAAAILDGEEQRALSFFRLLQDDVLIFTEEFVGPDLRELRSFITGYLHRDFQIFRDAFERMRSTAGDLLQRDRTFKTVLPLFSPSQDSGITVAHLLDTRMQSFIFDHPAIQNVLSREEREQFQLIGRRLREFTVLNLLRRAIIWMITAPDGEIVSADRRNVVIYSRSTRPMDFSKPGVVDPMIHRFGLIYDISAFSETLGNIRRAGGKEEIKSYRQMLLFQRKMEVIANRHVLQFEKFLGDGAFYTTRRAMRLIRAAVEIQRAYGEMKRKGFAFNKGLRIAINYGYYRLLPMKVGESETINEFYGPGIVELSRLTTGKANKEIDEIASFLVAHGYDLSKVQQFFAPLARGVDVIDHQQHAREHYAYVNANGHLMNEGIVASMALLQELSAELTSEAQQLHYLTAPWGTYIGFSPAIAGMEYVGIRLLGMVSLKGLEKIEVGEIVPFAPGDVEARDIESSDSFVTLLRQDYHKGGKAQNHQPQRQQQGPFVGAFDADSTDSTHERVIASEIVVCLNPAPTGETEEVLIGEWDPLSDDVHRPLRMPRGDFQRLFALKGEVNADLLADKKKSVRELYHQLSDRNFEPALRLSAWRNDHVSEAFLLG